MRQEHIKHLYNIAGFGLDINTFQSVKVKSKNTIVLDLFNASNLLKPLVINLSDFDVFKKQKVKQIKQDIGEAAFVELRKKSNKAVIKLNRVWLKRLSNTDAVIGEKMVLFWSNVFVCRDNDVNHIY
jgi:hypothetical protein